MKKTLFVGMAAMLSSTVFAAPAPDEFVRKAGASDLYEITSSRLLLDSRNAKAKSFATMMVRDHTQSTADVKAAAQQSGIKPPAPKLEPKQQANIAALRKASGTARDTLYIQQQKAAHQEALALHQDNATSGTAPALKAASAKIAPVVQHHLQMLNEM